MCTLMGYRRRNILLNSYEDVVALTRVALDYIDADDVASYCLF